MGQADYLDLGNWNAVCSMCGAKRKANTLVKNWQGMYRCPEHNEPRHPQDFVRAIPDIQSAPWVQPPTEYFPFPSYEINQDGDNTVPTSTTYDSILSIFDNVTVPTLTLSGTGNITINNWGIVSALINPGPAVITLRNFGRWL